MALNMNEVITIAIPVPMTAKISTGPMFLKKLLRGKAFTAPSLMIKGRKKFIKSGSKLLRSLTATSCPWNLKTKYPNKKPKSTEMGEDWMNMPALGQRSRIFFRMLFTKTFRQIKSKSPRIDSPSLLVF